MYLKNLTVLGFKSFADKISLNFQPGVTAIVGPNGCGKSNVSDAIRWVLGEQSAKALRGGEMADVIFNGTDTRKPLGMAEVSLTIGDVDNDQLKAAGIPMEFNEVTITRRVFRDGGSEYFLNRVPSRLKDIQQLFAGTGIGKTSYSVMAQGNITQILSSKPDDRRLVFEEAAGITRFKQQKKEALRKLESTEQNLLRVQDLIKEVKRQIGSLQRQAGKARRFKALQAEMQHLETQWARHQYDVLQEEIKQRHALAERTRLDIEVAQETIVRLEDEIIQLRTQLSEVDQQIALRQQQSLELKSETDRHHSKIDFNQQRLQELTDQNARAIHDISQATERKAIAEEELVNLIGRIETSQSQVIALRAQQDQRRDALMVVERELSGKQEELRRTQSEAFNASQTLGRLRSEINQLALQHEGNVVRMEKLNAEKIQLDEELARVNGALDEFTRQATSDRELAQTSRQTLEQRQQRLKALQGEIQQAQQVLDGVLRQQAEKRSRLNVLEQLDASREGFGAGALAALKQSTAVLGTIADRLRVPSEHVVAVEAALGAQLQLVLTQDPADATRILDDLRNQRKGRASIAALGLLPEGVANPAENSVESPVAGARRLLSVTQADPSIQPLLERLIGRTLLVTDLAAATAAFRETQGEYDFVTVSGELLTKQGIFTGGGTTGSGQAPASILGRKNQIAELQAELAKLQEAIQEASKNKGTLQSEQSTLQATVEQVRTELRQHEVTLATRQGEFNGLQGTKRGIEAKIGQNTRELGVLGVALQGYNEKREYSAGRLAQFEDQERASTARTQELTGQVETLRADRDSRNQEFNDAKIAFATEEQLFASHTRQRGPLEQRIRELTTTISRLQVEMGSFDERRGNFEAGITQSQREIERLNGERATLGQQVTDLQAEKKFQEGEIQAREEQLRERRTQTAAQQAKRSQLEVELTQKSMTCQNLRERIQQKYSLDLDSIQGEAIRISTNEEGQPTIETVTPEEMASAGLNTDWDAVAQQVQALQRKVDDIGAVNLVAIEEYEETEQRHNFLNAQYEDLVRAKQELAEVINRINTETKAMFVETFDKIRTNFQAMFVKLFGGGSADLRLVEEGDVLDAGIEIMARPPGKALRTISLLSGGEQTMTAVALLFSIYQVKPSPFCVLDELDAPLDESNINRFLDVLRGFIETSQFIVITHNKRTIAMGDAIYGVTMQERGVSKILSMKFNRGESLPSGPRQGELPTNPEPPHAPEPAPSKPEDHEVVLVK
ncbi:MAG TPA: chromosome segregation protein SMC [Candidatus Limnocylindria bacterium]|nr:chromosome segregation protein SMC [Candidatus Limnocylindria bacterium]